MTAVYKIVPRPEVEWVHATSVEGRSLLRTIQDRSPHAAWSPIPVKVVRHDEETGAPLQTGNLLWFGGTAMAIRGPAVAVARQIFGASVEFLPLASEHDLWLMNVVHLLDALDVDASEVVRFSSGRLMTVRKYAFLEDRLRGAIALKVPQLRGGPVFLTEPTVTAVTAAGLTGIGFQEVWRASGAG